MTETTTPAAPAPGCRFARDLCPGDTYLHSSTEDLGEDDEGLFVRVTPVHVVSGPTENATADPFGRTLMQFRIRDTATGNEGNAYFGPDGVVRTEITDRHFVLPGQTPQRLEPAMTENTPVAPTDAELAAAIDRGITAGTIIVCDDAWLASQRAELDAEAAPAPADPIRDLWLQLFAAHRSAYNLGRRHRTAAGDVDLSRQRTYRDGLLDAYVIVTGRSNEEVYEDLQAALIAEHEAQLADHD